MGIFSGSAFAGFDASRGAPINKHHVDKYWVISTDGRCRSRTGSGQRLTSDVQLGSALICDGDEITFVLDLVGPSGYLQIELNDVPVHIFDNLSPREAYRPVVSLCGDGSLSLIRTRYH